MTMKLYKPHSNYLKNLQWIKGENKITIQKENLINEIKKYI